MRYFAMIGGEQRGPYELTELSEAGVTPETYVWCKGYGRLAACIRRGRYLSVLPATDLRPDASIGRPGSRCPDSTGREIPPITATENFRSGFPASQAATAISPDTSGGAGRHVRPSRLDAGDLDTADLVLLSIHRVCGHLLLSDEP